MEEKIKNRESIKSVESELKGIGMEMNILISFLSFSLFLSLSLSLSLFLPLYNIPATYLCKHAMTWKQQ